MKIREQVKISTENGTSNLSALRQHGLLELAHETKKDRELRTGLSLLQSGIGDGTAS